MQQTISRILEGELQYEQPELQFSQEKIAVTLEAGTTLQSELYFGAADGTRLRGTITSSSRRFVPGFFTFEGGTIRLPYGVDATGLNPGDSLEGWLTITSNAGEHRLPFEIHTDTAHLFQRESGSAMTLEEFAALAERDFREAFRVFTSPDFPLILKDQPIRVQALAEAFSTQPVTYQHLEEFLVSCRLKERVVISVSETTAHLFDAEHSSREVFQIKKSGWGHVRIEVETVGSFLEAEQRVITEEDFIGSRFELGYLVSHSGGRTPGRRKGQIILRTPYQTIPLDIQLSSGIGSDVSLSLLEKKHRLSLLRDLLEISSGEIPFDEWAVGTRYSLDRLRDMGFDLPEYQMLEVWLLHQQGKDEAARKILETYVEKTFRPEETELGGMVVYLGWVTGMIQNRERAISRLSRLYMQQGDSPLLLHFLLEMDPNLRRGKEAMFRMEELYERGCTSPFLYLDAYRRLLQNPELLRSLSDFWVQVYHFMTRHELLNADLSMRFAYLAGYEKEFRPLVAHVLERCCELFPADDTLESLCRYLISGNPHRQQYFRWFSLAVNRGLRLTRLYEYYVETMEADRTQEMPRPLLMYFKYNSDTLGDSKKAFLYASVIADKRRDPETYELYQNHMKEFAVKKLAVGAISENYAVLYREFLTEPHHSHDATAIARVMQTCRLYTDEPGIRQVIVRHRELAREEIYTIVKGEAFPRRYTDSGVILFQDEKQRRYEATVDYSLTPLLEDPALVERVIELGGEEVGVQLAYLTTHEITRENLGIFQRASDDEVFSVQYRRELRSLLLDYFTAHVDGENLDRYLLQVDASLYDPADRARLIETLVTRGLDVGAMAIIEGLGSEGVSPQVLLRLASRTITRTEGREDEELLALSSWVFSQGYYDETVLSYLMSHRTGPIQDLFALRTCGAGFEMDTYGIEEKILKTLLFTGDYRKDMEEVLESYIRSRGDERLIDACLTHIAHGCFVREYPMSSFVLEQLYRAWQQEKPLPMVCRLALLKELSRGKAKGIPVTAVEDAILAECAAQGLGFAFFRRLPESRLARFGLDDKVYVELHENPEARVVLYYRLDSGLSRSAEWRSESLSCVFPGIFNRCFSLFYGESIHYYFQVEKGENAVRTSERVLTMNRVEAASISRYQRINQMLSARKLGRTQEVREKVKEYLRQEQYAAELFEITRS